jgi:hypothetical protein
MSALVAEAVEHLRWDTLSVVSYPKHDLVLQQFQRNISTPALGVAVNIGQTFLQNTEQGKLERSWQPLSSGTSRLV